MIPQQIIPISCLTQPLQFLNWLNLQNTAKNEDYSLAFSAKEVANVYSKQFYSIYVVLMLIIKQGKNYQHQTRLKIEIFSISAVAEVFIASGAPKSFRRWIKRVARRHRHI